MANPASGIDQAVWCKLETTFDTVERFVSGDSLGVMDLSIEPAQEYRRLREHRGTASLVSEVKGVHTVRWSCTTFVKPQAAGTAPDIGPLLAAAFGTATINASTSVVYTLNSSDPKTLMLARLDRTSEKKYYEVITGAWIETVEIAVVNNDETKITFSGGAATYGWVYAGAVTTGTVSSGATTFTLATGSRGKVGKNACILIGTDDGSANTGYLVTDYEPSTGVVTFSPALDVTQSGATTIYAFTPSFSLSGSAIGGVNCGLSVASTAIGFISGKVMIATGYSGVTNEASADRATRVSRGNREVTGEFECYYLTDQNATTIGKALDGAQDAVAETATVAIVLRAGPDTAAKRMSISLPAVRIAAAPLSVPEAEEVTVTLRAVARRSAADNDECVLTLD